MSTADFGSVSQGSNPCGVALDLSGHPRIPAGFEPPGGIRGALEGAMKLEISNGEVVPVSRRYELEVEARYANRERRAG